jgi:Ni,Fe-hydrogenase III component G
VSKALREALGSDYLGGYWRKKNRLFILINKDRILETTKVLMEKFDARICTISVVDLDFHGFDIIYHFALDSKEKNLHINVKARVSRDNPEIDSLAQYTPQANWAEREMMELVGINFKNHPEPKHLELPYEWPEQPK